MPAAHLSGYQRRRPEETALFQVVQRHWLTFVASSEEAGQAVPDFISEEFDDFLRCGILAHGFCRVHCDTCQHDRLVAWSCKGRGFCPGCMGRRMAEMQVHLSEQVLPEVPIRQWVLTVPKPIRYVLAYNRKACSAILNIFLGSVFRWLKWRAKQQFGLASCKDAHPGAVTAVQRHGSAADLNVHFHSLVTDGVFITTKDKADPVFRAMRAPSQADLATISWDICKKSIAWLRQHDLWIDTDVSDDTLAQEQPLVAACAAASLEGRVLFGARTGSGIVRLQDPRFARNASPPQSQSSGSGFHLHAAVRAAADDRKAKATLCRYIVRPPIANDRLRLLPDGRVELRLKRAYTDGTTHMLFAPLDFIARLVALIPPPRAHQVRFHGVFAPHHGLRSEVVPGSPLEVTREPTGDALSEQAFSKRQSWAMLLQKTFDIDVSVCARCGSKARVLAAVTEPAAIVRILKHMGIPAEPPRFHPARAPPASGELLSRSDLFDAA